MTSILITGGTGSFGKSFVKRLLLNGHYGRICIYSRDEYKQFILSKEFNDDRLRFFIGDVRDKERLQRALIGVDVVVHAAALKRIEVGNYSPDEMVKTNVFGSMNVVEGCFREKVKKAVLLSTDKAYQPISPYGQTKALAESLFLNANNTYGEKGPKFSVVRYGNIAGSTGSIIPMWRQKDPVITSGSCTRFFMRQDQAVDLVIDTIETMKGGELNIPELPAYELSSLAKAMNVNPRIIGLPAYEKKHECMEKGNCSHTARRMTVEELRLELESLPSS